MTKVKVLFVCLGNICRSLLAEAIFKSKVNQQGLTDFFEVDSCGTSNYHIGDRPDERTVANAHKNGIQIDHVGRQLFEEDLAYYDFIIAMDKSNYNNILQLKGASAHSSKIRLMREFDYQVPNGEVPDPYFGGSKGFQDVYEILDRSAAQFLQFIQKNHLKS